MESNVLSIPYMHCLDDSKHIMRVFKENDKYIFMMHLGNFTLKEHNNRILAQILIIKVEELINEHFAFSTFYLTRKYFFQLNSQDKDKLLKFLKEYV